MQTSVERKIDLDDCELIPLDDQPPHACERSRFEPSLWRRVIKRALDVLGAAAGLIVLSPVLAVVAAAVKLTSPGPVFYRQERLGLGGRPFTIVKFRSMVQEAEANGPIWSAGSADPRLTRIGGFLRATHLDELPQLWNVLRGDMSLVGPRPERPCFSGPLEESIPGYEERCWVKPGMTGLAQVHYRYDATIEDVKRKLRFDRLYIRRMCLTLDLQILAWTVGVVLARRGH
jgi:lipopolysaccharide/colanic/teichoic acid biosynthesis glycosyltransferase